MRITTVGMYSTGLANMLNQQSAVAKAQDQVGSGLKFNTAADDPLGMAQVLSLQDAKSAQTSYSRNVSTLQQRLGGADGTLSSVANVLNRVRDLTVQANSATLTSSDRSSIATELGQLQAQLVDLANSSDGAGHYQFAGTAEVQAPFTLAADGSVSYSGTQDVRTLNVGSSHGIAEGDSGDAVFLRVGGSGGSLFQRIQTIIDTVNAPSDTDAQRTANQAAFKSGLQALDDGITHIGNVRASVGSRLATLDDVASHLSAVSDQIDQTISDTQDLNYAEAASRLQLQATALQAAQAAFARVQGLSLFNYLK